MTNRTTLLKTLRSCFTLGLSLLSATLVFLIWIHGHERLGFDRAPFMEMVNGSAPRPFVHRALIPSLVRLGAGLLPRHWKGRVDAWIDRFVSARILRQEWSGGHELEHCLALALIFLSLLGFMAVLRWMAQGFYHPSPWIRELLPVAAVSILPVFFLAGTHFVYDFPALFFFTLLLALLWRQRWGWFYPLYAVALLNKETTLFLALLFALHFFSRMPRRRYFAHLLAMVGLFVLVKAGLTLAFAGNPGPLLENHLRENLFTLLTPFPLWRLLDVALVLLLLFQGFRKKPEFLRHGLFLVVPIFLLQLFFGVLGEIRVYYEVYPILFLLAVPSALAFLGMETPRLPGLSGSPEGQEAAYGPEGAEPRGR